MPEFSVEFWVGAGLAILTLLLGLGATLAMDAKTKGEFRFAVGCFIISALMMAATVVMWGVAVKEFDVGKAVTSVVLFAAIGVGLIVALRWTRARHERAAGSHGESEEHKERHISPPGIRAYLQPNGPYEAGIMLGGIVWQSNYVDVRLDVSAGSTDAQNVDLIIELDTSIAGVGQLSQFEGITAFPANQTPPVWLEGTTPDGKPSSVPVVPAPGMAQIVPAYRIRCSNIFSNTTAHFVIASIALNPAINGQLPKQLFAARRNPQAIRVVGTFEDGGRKYPIAYSHRL
jgi:hypothetical protein